MSKKSRKNDVKKVNEFVKAHKKLYVTLLSLTKIQFSTFHLTNCLKKNLAL